VEVIVVFGYSFFMKNEVLKFWFEQSGPEDWFKKSTEFDQKIKERFEKTYWQVLAGECSDWRENADGRLAEIIVLDQFARNMFRGEAQAFRGDILALALSQEVVRQGADKDLSDQKRAFLYMPFMHSESAKVHETAVKLFKDLPQNYEYELKHKEIIDKFGRYPHRNEALGRKSTPEELEFIKNNDGF
jgi:uncharacterized protein (DUF924 family)